MLVLIVYDIETISVNGKARLHKVAKICESVGRRVQNSVFECELDAARLRALQAKLKSITDPKADRIRYYNLGNHYSGRIMDDRPQKRITSDIPLIL